MGCEVKGFLFESRACRQQNKNFMTNLAEGLYLVGTKIGLLFNLSELKPQLQLGIFKANHKRCVVLY
jgi:hypothetical protein